MTLLSKSDCYCSTVIHTCISARSFDVNFISLVPSKGLWFNWTPTRKTRLAILNIPTSPPNTQKCAHPGLLCSKKSRVHHRCIGCGMFFLHLRTCISADIANANDFVPFQSRCAKITIMLTATSCICHVMTARCAVSSHADTAIPFCRETPDCRNYICENVITDCAVTLRTCIC